MSRITCKTCRRIGESLCGREKCAFKRKPFAPGRRDFEKKHRSTVTEYGAQLREKQKIRSTYSVSEKQFARYVKESVVRSSSNPAEWLYEELELRLDNTAYRAGFAKSRAEARQLVSHGHILVNGRRVTIPSYKLRVGDALSIRKESEGKGIFGKTALEGEASGGMSGSIPSWIQIDPKEKKSTIAGKPHLDSSAPGLLFKSVIEFYSR